MVVGEAGIGKSRLVQAVLDETAEDPHIVLRYQCSPHYTGTPLWPVVQQLGFAAGFAPNDSDEQKRHEDRDAVAPGSGGYFGGGASDRLAARHRDGIVFPYRSSVPSNGAPARRRP